MLINDIFTECLDIFVMTYLDDLMIYLKNLNEYQKYIRIVLNKLFKKKFKHKSEIYEFHKKEIDFFKFLIGINSIKIDPKKVKAVKKQSELKNLTKF